jgi:hypothetical protein
MRLLWCWMIAFILTLQSGAQALLCSKTTSQGRLILHDIDLPPKQFRIEKLTLTLIHAYVYSLEPVPQDWELRISNHSDDSSTLSIGDRNGAHPMSRMWMHDLDIQVCRPFASDDQIEVGAQIVVLGPTGEQKTLPYGNMSFSFVERQARRRLHAPAQ